MSELISKRKLVISRIILFTVIMVQSVFFPLFSQQDCVGMNSLNGWVTQGLVQLGNAGVDFYGGFPVAGPATGNSIRVGNNFTFAQPFSSASRTFTVSAASPYLQYYYAMVNLDFPHPPAAAATSAIRILDPAGNVIPCTFYQVFAAAGGPPGFQQSPRPNECNLINQCAFPISYLPWQSSIVDLSPFIGMNVTIQLTNAWCGPGVDWGYAYFDAHCVDFGIQQTCVGSATTLTAPPGGNAYLWSTGEVSQSITINTAGVYNCQITPVQGAACNINLSINATIFPAPDADFTVNTNSICAGGSVEFTDNSTVTNGGAVNSYQWDFGDGIITPASSGPIVGVPQTAGTYTLASHTYNLAVNPNVTLTIETADGCTSTHTEPIVITNAPTAIIDGNDNLCQNDPSPLVTFTGNGTAGPFTFTYNLDGGANQTVTSTVGNPNATLTVPTNTSGTFTYNLISVSDPSSPTCNQAQVGAAVITVNPMPTAQISGTATVCQNGVQPAVTFTGANGSSEYTFTYNINGGANQTITTVGSSSVILNAPTGVAGTFTYNLLNVEDVVTGCEQAQAGVATIVVNPMPTAQIVGTTTVCQNDVSPMITFSGASGTSEYIFTYNINGGANQTITTAGSNSVTLNVSTSNFGAFTYNLISVQDLTTGCEQPQIGSAIVNINPMPTGQISGTATICQNGGAPVVTFTGANGSSNYTFIYTLNGGANQSITTVGGASTATISAPTGVAGSFDYALVSVSDVITGCGQPQNGNAVVTVDLMPTAQISGATVLCQNDIEPVVTFTGANGSADYIFTYNINGGANQTVSTAGANSVTVNVSTSNSGVFTYNLLNVQDAVSLCGQPQIGATIITINPLPTAQISGTTTICQYGIQPVITFTGANGSSNYTFVYNINGGPNQTVTTIGGSTTATINIPTVASGSFVYNLVSVMDVLTGCGQPQIGSSTITVNPMPTAIIAGTSTVCLNSPSPEVNFTGTNGSTEYIFTYNINGGTNQTIVTTGNDNAVVYAPTSTAGEFVYNLLNVQDATTLCGQVQLGAITINVNALPTASITNSLEVCLNDPQPTLTFTGAVGTSPFTFLYSLNGGVTQNITTSPGYNSVSISVPTNIAGTFNYVITNIQEGSVLACQQTQNVTTTIIVHSLPVVYAGNDISLCVGETVILTGSGAGVGGIYTWDNTILNGIGFIPADTTIYTVTGTDINGCKDTDEVTVNVVPFPVMNIQGYNLSGCEPVTSSFDNLSSGNLVNCTWVFSNGETIADCGPQTVTFEDAGCYDVTLYASTPEGCSNTITLTNYVCVDANPLAAFEATPDELSTYNWESQMENQSFGADSYSWDFGDGSSNSNATNPSHEFPNVYGGTYEIMLIAITDAGCRDTAYQTIKLREELLYYVPNTFTPDGDMYNETFKPVFATGFDPQGYTLLIFNRWGDIVFESHDVNVGWNGLYNGINAQDGTYSWKIEVKSRTNSKIHDFNGHVNLLR